MGAVGKAPLMNGRPVVSVNGSSLSLEQFRKMHFQHADGAVAFRGLAWSWPACREWAGESGVRRLAGRYGHRTVPVELRNAKQTLTEKLMTLCDFVESKLLGPGSLAAAQAGETAYLAQHDLFSQIPELQTYIETPEYRDGKLSVVNVWFGTGGTITRAHFDSYE